MQTVAVNSTFGMDDQLSVDDDVLVGFGPRGLVVLFVFPDKVYEDAGGFGALFVRILFDRRQGRVFQVIGDRQIGIADEADVLIDLQLLRAGILHGIERDIVVDHQDRGWAGALGEQLLHGFEGIFPGQIGIGDETEIDLQSFFDEDLFVGFGPFFGGAHFFGSVEDGDTAMSFFDEEPNRLAGAAIHVGVHLVEAGKGGYAVEEDERDTIFFECGEMIIGYGIGAQGGDDAIDPVVLHRTHDAAFAFDIVPGLADKDAVFVLGGNVLDAI